MASKRSPGWGVRPGLSAVAAAGPGWGAGWVAEAAVAVRIGARLADAGTAFVAAVPGTQAWPEHEASDGSMTTPPAGLPYRMSRSSSSTGFWVGWIAVPCRERRWMTLRASRVGP